MRAFTYTGARSLEWQERPDAVVAGEGEAVVRPLAVATCDLDDAIAKGLAPFPPGFVLGHEGVGEVVDVGDGVTTVAPGDRVLIPFQISCGDCTACRQGRTGNCASVPIASTYGFGFGEENTRWGGFLADLIHVPYADAMLVPVPEGLAPEIAAGASDNITDAYRTVAPHLAARPGAPVLVVSGAYPGSIGLYAAAQAIALGSERVVYIDPDPARRALAEGYGAETMDHLPERLDKRFPITVANTLEVKGLELALGSLGRDGVCTATGVFFQGEVGVKLPLLAMYVYASTFISGRIHARPDVPKVLEMLADGTFDPEPVTTKVVPFADAAEALLEGDYTKLVFTP